MAHNICTMHNCINASPTTNVSSGIGLARQPNLSSITSSYAKFSRTHKFKQHASLSGRCQANHRDWRGGRSHRPVFCTKVSCNKQTNKHNKRLINILVMTFYLLLSIGVNDGFSEQSTRWTYGFIMDQATRNGENQVRNLKLQDDMGHLGQDGS